MAGTRKARKEELEAAAAAFLAETESPRASDRLRDFGLQRILARQAEGTERAAAGTRRAYRNPALLRRAVLAAAVVLLVMLVSTSGAYALSYNAQPDSPLYGTKIFFERARVTLNLSSTGDMRLEMGFSERRMEELRKMAASGDQEGAERWLREYSRNVEGAGTLFENLPDQEALDMSTQFEEMLNGQAQMMQGMRQQHISGLSEPLESAYHVCEQERERMQRRCGQEAPGGPSQEPGGQRGQGNCSTQEGSSTSAETPSSTEIIPADEGTGYSESGSPMQAPPDTPAETTADEPADTPSDISQPMDSQGSEGGQTMAGDTGYQAGSPQRGHMP